MKPNAGRHPPLVLPLSSDYRVTITWSGVGCQGPPNTYSIQNWSEGKGKGREKIKNKDMKLLKILWLKNPYLQKMALCAPIFFTLYYQGFLTENLKVMTT